MANVFRQNADVNEHPNRNNFDLFYQNHMSMKIGTLYPFCCKPVVPGDSFRINTAIGLKFMPLAFPVQSRMRAVVHYFYVRNKNLWDDWYNFVQGLEDKTHPYIDKDVDWFKTGSLADYLGLPTTVVSNDYGYTRAMAVDSEGVMIMSWLDNLENGGTDFYVAPEDGAPISLETSDGQTIIETTGGSITLPSYSVSPNDTTVTTSPNMRSVKSNLWSVCNALGLFQPLTTGSALRVYLKGYAENEKSPYSPFQREQNAYIYAASIIQVRDHIVEQGEDGNKYIQFTFQNNLHKSFDSNQSYIGIGVAAPRTGSDTDYTGSVFTMISSATAFSTADESGMGYITLAEGTEAYNKFKAAMNEDGYIDLCIVYSIASTGSKSIASVAIQSLGVYTELNGNVVGTEAVNVDTYRDLRINALPFRAYESIYNAFYRNTQNQPFVLNGEKQFNRYNTTKASGADTTDYHLFRRNWQLDFMTSALPSPQQGVAPLVGLVKANGDVTITDDDGNVTNATLGFDSDGDTLTGKVSIHNPAASTENNITLSQAAMAAAGMSINDFRNVNALQHWLETNMRKGYKYKDFIEGHFGKSPRYEELDMPEFIGGFTQDVNVSLVTQTTPTDGHPLGSYAANANAFGQGRSITHYCDDYGYIMGIVCVVPDPAYSQLLPKHFLAHSKLDYYFPEFAQLGMQPIPMSEVSPLQVAIENPVSSERAKQMQRTFGYQRPNYDLVAAMDEVHGQFRTTLKDYLIQRIFGQHPELGTDFLQIKNDEVDNIFTYHSPDEDNIIGQIVVDIKAKRPIPRIHMPSLGR